METLSCPDDSVMRKENKSDYEFQIALPPEFKGKKINVTEYGDPYGPIVINIHGWSSNGTQQEEIINNLKEFHTYSIDLPGCGKSEALESNDCHLERYVDVLDWLVRELTDGVQVHTIMGHSMGGVLAIKLALERHHIREKAAEMHGLPAPERITKKLVLTSVPIEGTKDGAILTTNQIFPYLFGAFIDGTKKLPDSVKKFKARMNAGGIVRPLWIDDKYVAQDFGTDGRSAADTAEQLSRVKLGNTDPVENLDVALFHGSNDRYTSPETIIEYAARLGAKVKIYQGANHDVHEDVTVPLSKDVRAFITSE